MACFYAFYLAGDMDAIDVLVTLSKGRLSQYAREGEWGLRAVARLATQPTDHSAVVGCVGSLGCVGWGAHSAVVREAVRVLMRHERLELLLSHTRPDDRGRERGTERETKQNATAQNLYRDNNVKYCIYL